MIPPMPRNRSKEIRMNRLIERFEKALDWITAAILVALLLIVLGFLLFVGTWPQTNATIVLLAPTLATAMQVIGYHPVHFGMIMTLAVNIGLITPPLGVCLFAASATGQIKVEAIVAEIWPFIGASVVILVIVALFPKVSTFLPRLLGLI